MCCDQHIENKADIVSKKADIVYEKLVVLLASSGAIGGFGVSMCDKAPFVALVVFVPFLVLSFGIILAYLKLGDFEKEIKGLKNG